MSEEAPWLIVGLGNPGPQYVANRHNIGFVVVDHLVAECDGASLREKFQGHFCKTTYRRHDVVMVKPMTYMNLSGDSVQPAAKFFKIPPERIVVVHDELDLPFGTVRLKFGGGLAGHNGLRSIAERLGTKDFLRVRVGVGRPRSQSVSNWVLSDFSQQEAAELTDVIERSIKGMGLLFSFGIEKAMARFHTKPKPKKPKKKKPPEAQTGGLSDQDSVDKGGSEPADPPPNDC